MDSTPIVDAVTGILEFQGEIYMARRDARLAAFSGYQAFPGGKVDPADGGQEDALAAHLGVDARLFRALAREVEEELGLDLRSEFAGGFLIDCCLLGTAIPPAFVPIRFHTRFFMLRLGRRPAITLDAREHDSGEWARPQEWLARYETGGLLLAPPTYQALKALAGDPRCPEIPFGNSDGESEVPLVEAIRGVRQFPVRSHTLPPARHTNCFLIGDAGSHRILVDPSPDSLAELDRLQAAVRDTGFDEIFLTHHHPDHHEHADELARRCGVPIGVSEDSHARISAASPRFFNGITVNLRREGDVVCHWLGQPVRVIAVPGHDEGQLALMPDNAAWCIVGDLIQGIGTVVIAAPEGDMRKYFQSMEKVIALEPRAIYPSHGTALGGTHYLEKTLEHRRGRERQIKELVDAGYSIDDILPVVYQGLPPGLLPLARKNIESHLAKLRAEGAVA